VSAALPGGWRSTWSAAGELLTIDMRDLPGTGVVVAERVRVGPVLFDLGARKRRLTVVVRLAHRQVPTPTLSLRLPSPGPGLVEVDGVTLQGSEVRFSFSGQHEVVAYY